MSATFPKRVLQAVNAIDYTLTTNAALRDEQTPGFIFSAQIFEDSDGVHVSVSPNDKAIILSGSLRDQHASGEYHPAVVYLTKDEVQGAGVNGKIGDLTIPENYRMIRIMPVLQLRQNGSISIPLSYRGPGAANRDHWGCASSLASTEVNKESIYATLNRETGILINGQPAIFAPQDAGFDAIGDDIEKKIVKNALAVKNSLGSKVPQIASAFARGASTVTIPTTMEFEGKQKAVDFHGNVLRGSMDAIVSNDKNTRTLTLIFPIVADVPNDAQIVVFNGEGYAGPTTLATREDLKVAKAGMPLIPGLREFVHGA